MNSFDTYTIIALLVGIVFPVYALFTGKHTIRMLEKHPDRLSSVFRSSGIILVTLTALITGSMLFNQESPDTIGLSFISSPMWIAMLLMVSVISYLLIQKIKIPDSKIESIAKSYEGVSHILPKSVKEYRWMVALSFIAGVGEEIIFRGFLFWQLNQYVSIIPSILIVNQKEFPDGSASGLRRQVGG